MQFIKAFLDLIFPPRCEVCRGLGPEALCEKCQKKINFLSPSAFIHSVGVYEGPLKTAIQRFKFKKKINLAEPLGVLLVKYLSHNLDMNLVDLIVPVPLHERRVRERGFNQAELLSHTITKYYDVPTVSGALFRTRETHPQFDLPRAERIKNVRGAFEVKGGSLLRDRSLLLLDDIYTTGSTVSECTRVLKAAGARQVHVLTLSRAIMV
jgi:ComF family protein